MKKFTFLVEFRGGTYISQYKAINLTEALFLWANNVDVPVFTNKIQERIKEKIKEEDFFPIAVKTVDNVWCTSYVIFRSLLLLNIVETV